LTLSPSGVVLVLFAGAAWLFGHPLFHPLIIILWVFSAQGSDAILRKTQKQFIEQPSFFICSFSVFIRTLLLTKETFFGLSGCMQVLLGRHKKPVCNSQ